MGWLTGHGPHGPAYHLARRVHGSAGQGTCCTDGATYNCPGGIRSAANYFAGRSYWVADTCLVIAAGRTDLRDGCGA